MQQSSATKQSWATKTQRSAKLGLRNALDLDGNWPWIFQFFLAVFYGAFLLILGKSLAIWLYDVQISEIIEFASLACVMLSAVILWIVLLKASGRTSRSAMTKLIDEHRGTIIELLQSNNDLESEICNSHEELSAASLRFGIVMQKFKISVFQCDLSHRYVWAQNFMMEQQDIIGKCDDQLMPASAAEELRRVKSAALADDRIHETELLLVIDKRAHHYSVHVASVRNAEGDVIGTTMISLDVTDKVKSHQHLLMMLREVNHRALNSLSVVMSIASLSATHAKSIESFMASLMGRVTSLVQSQSALSEANWAGANCRDVVTKQLGKLPAALMNRTTLDGPCCLLWPKAVQTIGLAVHELATLAIEGGVLDTNDGRILVEWYSTTDGPAPVLNFRWTVELGHAPLKFGDDKFRQVFLEKIAGPDLGGHSRLERTATGWTFSLSSLNETLGLTGAANDAPRSVPHADENRMRQEYDRQLLASTAQRSNDVHAH